MRSKQKDYINIYVGLIDSSNSVRGVINTAKNSFQEVDVNITFTSSECKRICYFKAKTVAFESPGAGQNMSTCKNPNSMKILLIMPFFKQIAWKI